MRPYQPDPPILRPLTITYLLEDTVLFGGTKVALHQANLMARRGHDVQVVSPGPLPDWYPLDARFLRLASTPLAATPPAELPPADVTVATFWTTLAPAAAAITAAGRGEAVHYCQGFEAGYTHNQAEHPAILAAYGLPLPALAVAPHLAALLSRRFGRPARVVPQPLEPFWVPAAAPAPSSPSPAPVASPAGRPPRVLVASPFEIDWKGVATALAAVRLLRRGGLDCRLVRLSQWPLGPAERELLSPDEFHHRLPPPAVARLVAGCPAPPARCSPTPRRGSAPASRASPWRPATPRSAPRPPPRKPCAGSRRDAGARCAGRATRTPASRRRRRATRLERSATPGRRRSPAARRPGDGGSAARRRAACRS